MISWNTTALSASEKAVSACTSAVTPKILFAFTTPTFSLHKTAAAVMCLVVMTEMMLH